MAPVRRLIIGATRNWSRNVLLWNLSADPRNNPHTVYAIAHASKFVRPSSYGIGSNNLETLPNVAFQTPEKKTVLIVVNTARSPRAFHIRYRDKLITTVLATGAVWTYLW